MVPCSQHSTLKIGRRCFSRSIAAISAFTQIPEQKATIATYSAYFGDDHQGMGRMVAGFVTDPVFIITDLAQWFLAPITCILALLEWRPLRSSRGPANWIRLAALLAALALVAIHNIGFAPSMAEDLAAYRDAAAANDRGKAEAAYADFDQYHKTAETLFGIRMLLLLIALVASAAAVPLAPRTQERRE